MKQQTIAAVATPAGASGLGIIRISGPDALSVASRVFSAGSGKLLTRIPGYSALFGRVHNAREDLDEAVALVFLAPKSYTGEDTVELSCHGGPFILQKVLRACLDAGAAPAQPGEFSKRAFLNGKMTLTQAESVMDLIASQNDQAARAALGALDGGIYRKISAVSKQLIELDGHLAAWVDFPEEDIEEVRLDRLSGQLRECMGELTSLLNDFDKGKIIKNGVDTVIAGKPNVGKSTLMNLLAGYGKSIVTDIPGTTRDVVEETIRLSGVILNLADTAGLRDTADPVEIIGVERTKSRLQSAGLVLAVFDNSELLTGYDRQLLTLIAQRPCVAVINKSDLAGKLDTEEIKKKVSHVVTVSAKDGTGAKELEEEILTVLNLNHIEDSYALFINERQRQCTVLAVNYLNQALEAAVGLQTLDAVTVMIDSAIDALLELTGEKASEAVIDNVFSRFCVGK